MGGDVSSRRIRLRSEIVHGGFLVDALGTGELPRTLKDLPVGLSDKDRKKYNELRRLIPRTVGYLRESIARTVSDGSLPTTEEWWKCVAESPPVRSSSPQR